MRRGTAALMSSGSLGLVIPAHNEAARLGATLDTIAAYLVEQRIDAHIVVVDDGSRDGTAEVAAARNGAMSRLDVLSLPHQRGKGAAVRAGVLATAADIIGFTDADLSTPIDELPRMLAALEAGADIAIGSRGLAESQVLRAQPAYRRAGATIFRQLVRSIGGLQGFSDTQCGFKFYRRAVAHDLFGSTVIKRWMFDLEVLRLAVHRGYRVTQVPVKWTNHRDSRLRLTVDTIRMIRDLVRIQTRFWGTRYGPAGAPGGV